MDLLLTIDTEPDWGIRGWDAVRQALPVLLERLAARRAAATFFIVGNAVDAAPEVLAGIQPPHEIGSHGLTHRPMNTLPERELHAELADSRKKLEDFFRRPVRGVRAPFFRTSPVWLEQVASAGYEYESSLGSVWPGPPNLAPGRWTPRCEQGVWRLPITTFRDGVTPFCLTYLRLAPWVFRHLIHPDAGMFYFHLHEFLSPETAAVLPSPVFRALIRRNAGDRAWRLLDELLERGKTFATCSDFLDAWKQGQPAAGEKEGTRAPEDVSKADIQP